MRCSVEHLKGACQDQRIMWPHVAQVKRLQCHRALQHYSEIIISSTLHHLSKSDFRHHLILPVLISLPSLDLCFTPLLSLSLSRFTSSFDSLDTSGISLPLL